VKKEVQVKVGVEEKEKYTIKKSKGMVKEERRKRSQEMDQFRRQRSSLEKKIQEVERSLREATQNLDQVNKGFPTPISIGIKKRPMKRFRPKSRSKSRWGNSPIFGNSSPWNWKI
jgi:hypothetical protein